MKTRLGSAIVSSLLFAQGLLGFAAVAAVLMKEPGKEHRVAAISAADEGLVLVR
ncbi:hypothetical protein SAZ10_07010 [Mesorhizobium sp. BAC0120]|uniref:hypothetical protein n=1 Tax=Mesorhizobium sp. BAC0120 TaxID=3090670 RepID=UPI00298CCF9D|nr:hypothetical protein [Mesorhizobium sp. BAC0120]MDW6021512.1 hypothetical protein [Mesorhizobium sp. BAC0120]